MLPPSSPRPSPDCELVVVGAAAVALPAIGADVGAGLSALQWMLNASTLTLSALLLLGGSLGDRLGTAGCSWPAWSCSRPRLWRAPPQPAAGS